MFTGRIRVIGKLTAVRPDLVEVAAPPGALEPGSSVAVSGVCVTVSAVQEDGFRASLSRETRLRSTFDRVDEGTLVNVELPLRVGDPFDGHMVQGHVEAVGKVVRISDEPVGRRAWIRPPRRFLDDLVAKSSVAVDGVSLTVAEVVRDRFSVALVPSTLAETTLSLLQEGHRVNLESDLVGRVARRWSGVAQTSVASIASSLPWAGRLSGRMACEKAVAQFASGGGVVIWDPEREGEGDLAFAGADLQPSAVTFLLTQACGHTTVPCDGTILEQLEIPPMPGRGDYHGTAPHVPVDLAQSTGTGVSAVERAATIRRLAFPAARPGDFLQPGHVFPLRVRDGGLDERRGHTEAAIALCRAARVRPVAAICEIMAPTGEMAGPAELECCALTWGLPMVTISDLHDHL